MSRGRNKIQTSMDSSIIWPGLPHHSTLIIQIVLKLLLDKVVYLVPGTRVVYTVAITWRIDDGQRQIDSVFMNFYVGFLNTESFYASLRGSWILVRVDVGQEE